MKHTRMLIGTFLLGSVLNAAPALANPSGSVGLPTMGPIYKANIWLDANVPYTIETTDLVPVVPGNIADTVIHVQKQDANGTYLAGNDDYNGMASHVDLTVATSQWVDIIVRAYSEDRGGTATLKVWRNGTLSYTDSAQFAAGRYFPQYGMVTGTQVTTVENWNGPRDSVILVITGGASHAIAFDDDDGVNLQSWLKLESACPASDCMIVYGRYGRTGGSDGPGTMLWDGDVGNGLDQDKDGLGDSFEDGVSHTDRTILDTDLDGLGDGAEVIGVDNGGTLLKLPMWGANPLTPDVFEEVDWEACDVATNPGCGGNVDAFQLASTEAVAAHNLFWPDINLHLDIGRANYSATNLAEWMVWGNWGGASRTAQTDWCQSLTPGRVGYFRVYRINGTSGGQGAPLSYCAYGANNGRSLSHELGHNLGLNHEGNRGTGQVNSKPNYPSLMNYAYILSNSAVGFSRGLEPTLNATKLVETNTTLSPARLTELAGSSFGFVTDPTNKKIDWNRDGKYDTITSRGAPTWVLNDYPETTSAWYHGALDYAYSATLARMSSPSRLYLFSRLSSNQVQYRYTSSFASCTGSATPLGQDCVTWTNPTVISNALIPTAAGAAAYRVTISSKEKLMLVYATSDGKLYYQLGDSADVWSAPTAITSGVATDFKPELIPGTVQGLRVYYKDATSGNLNHRDFDSYSSKWSYASVDTDSSGNKLSPSFGVSIVKGYESSITGTSFYMAISNSKNSNKVELWRWSTTNGNWTQLSDIWVAGQQVTKGAPTLAYVPFVASTPSAGQFYIVFMDASGTEWNRFWKSEGNDTKTGATSRRLQFRNRSIPVYNAWGYAWDNPELFYELGVDANLRLAYTNYDKLGNKAVNVTWHPIADGIFDIDLKDQDDFYVMRKSMSCGIGHGACPGL